MSDPLLRVTDLHKSFRRRGGGRLAAIAGLTLEVPEGGVFGIVGPNGSGKTTFLRLVLGLVRPDSGRIELFGRRVPQELPQVVSRVGALVEGPLLLPNVTGRRNLEILGRIRDLPARRIVDVLELVELLPRADEPVRSYSLGMRQRLGIAAALLSEPTLLILDEPSNGLDPLGMARMRAFIARLADGGGVTVLLSSHLLADVERLATHVAVIDRGRLVATGTPAELTARSAPAPALTVHVSDAPRAAELLRAAGYAVATQGSSVQVDGQDRRGVLSLLLGAGVDVLSLDREGPSLESAFLDLTQGRP